MKTKLLTMTIIAAGIFISCREKLETEATFSATVSTPKEYERPLVTVTRTGAQDAFFPCQAVIDGMAVTTLNAAGTTLLDRASQVLALPRLAPGHHKIDLVIGKGRRLYRDAEAACGEKDKTLSIDVEVESSSKAVIVLSFDKTDVDRYVFIPEDKYALDCNTGKKLDFDKFSILSDTYTVTTYPFSSQKDGFSVSGVGKNLDVKAVDTAVGKGIDIKTTGKGGTDAADSRFSLSASGVDLVVQVAG